MELVRQIDRLNVLWLPLKCVQWKILLGGAFGRRMFGGSPHFLFWFLYAKYMCKHSQWEQDGNLNIQTNIVNFYFFINADVFIRKKRIPTYMKAIHTSVYIQQPGHRGFINKNCGDPPNIRTNAPPKYISHCTHFKGCKCNSWNEDVFVCNNNNNNNVFILCTEGHGPMVQYLYI